MAEPNSSSDAEGTTMANGSGPSAESKTNVVANSEKKESSAKDDEVEGTATMNGSGPSPKDKTSVVADSQKKENTGKKDEVEGTAMTNGSALPPEDMSVVPDSEKNGKESKTVEEEKDSDERADSEEKKHGEENDTTKAEDMDESKEDKKTEDVTTAEAEDVKMADVEVEKAMEVEGGVKEEEEEGGAKEEGQGGKEWEEEEGEEGAKEEEGEEGAKEEEGGGKEGEEEGGEEGAKEEGGGKKREEGGGKEGAKEVENVVVEGDNGSTKKKVDGDKDAERTKKKRLRGQAKAIKKSKAKEHVTKVKHLLSSPVTSSIERPVRERKTVERLVEVIEKEPSREFQVEKGRGTPLKDIPNVAYKLAKKKPADIKLIHQTLFGRKGKAVNFKNHILQFSGFVWHESDEKQRAKMKEKLDKYVKDTLLDLCDLFDLPVSKANIRKEDLVAKLLDFLVAPHPTTEVILSEDKQSTRSRKRKRVAKESGSKIMEDTHKPSRKKRSKSEDTLTAEGKSAQEMDDEDDEGDMKDGCPYKGKVVKHSENEDKESESEEAFEEDEHDEEEVGKSKHDQKKTPKQGSVGKEKVGISSKKSPKSPTAASTKNLTKSLSSKRSKAEHDDDVGTKVFSRKKRIVDSPKKKSTPRSEKKEKDTGKKVAKGRAKSEAEHPSKEELRKKICEILKEVDFNTATFTDILKQLAVHYKVDLTPRKASIKLLIQEELTKLAEAEEDEDDEDEEDAENEENGKPTGKKVEA